MNFALALGSILVLKFETIDRDLGTMGMDLRVVPAEEWLNRGRDSSHDGERDLGLMVTDFLETGGGGSGGAGSWCSSDSDSGFPDPSYLSDKIQVPTLHHFDYLIGFNSMVFLYNWG